MVRDRSGKKVTGKLVWDAERDCWVEIKPKEAKPKPVKTTETPGTK